MAESATKRKPSTRKPSTGTNGNGEQPSPAPVAELNAAVEQLQRPFTFAAVKIKPQATAERNGGLVGLVTYYIDSRLVVERLNTVVGPAAWSESYKPLLVHGADMAAHQFPVECTLTVLGVSRTDVGAYQKNTPDDKAWKSGYSDALKRAGVKFRIGAYLYGSPNVWVECKVGRNGKAQGFTDAGRKRAQDVYEAWLKNVIVPKFGEPLDHGLVVPGESIDAPANDEPVEASGNGQPEASTKQKAAPSPTPADRAPRGDAEPPDGCCGKVDDAALVSRLLAATEQIGAKDVALNALAKHRADNDGWLKHAWITSQVERAEEAAALQNGTANDKPITCDECGGTVPDHKEGCSNDIPF